MRRWWSLVVVGFVLAGAIGVGGAPPTSPTPARTLPAAVVEPLVANASAVAVASSWNCGQGSSTFDLFGRGSGGAAPYQYRWDFGDGSAPSAAQDPVHAFHDVTGFTANLTITDATNRTAIAHVSAGWAIPLVCAGPTTVNWMGVAVYLALVAGVALAAIWIIRSRRHGPLP